MDSTVVPTVRSRGSSGRAGPGGPAGIADRGATVPPRLARVRSHARADVIRETGVRARYPAATIPGNISSWVNAGRLGSARGIGRWTPRLRTPSRIGPEA